MTTWARKVDGRAVDVTTFEPSQIFPPDVAAQFIVVPDGTENGATENDDGSWTNPTPPVPPTPTPDQTPFEISPGQLRNRLPWQSEAWLEENQHKTNSDATKNQFAAVVWGRLKDSRTINVVAQNVIDLGAAMVALSIPSLDAAAMAVCLTAHPLPGETRDGLLG